ncbi:MAG TPA: glucose-6-phosphate isomerase [Methanosarcinaceae archaeon]|nr:glucose-6-phosphate isomerase [Methanosarcinaceae archaeon]
MGKELEFGELARVADIRMLYDMDEVIYDRTWLGTADNFELYYMFRDMYKTKTEADIIKEHNLRYDITVIPPNMLGREYIKTAGHYHPEVPGTGMSYTEVYHIFEGEATYLLQKTDNGKITDVVVITAQAGDNVIVPPDYGHITINATDKVLRMANWVNRDFSSVYEPMKELAGGAYYLLESGFIRNPKYDNVPPIRYLKPTNYPEFGFIKGEDMYGLVDDIEKLAFLTSPQDFTHLFEKILAGT